VDDLLVEHVLRAVEAVPPGRVTTYGAIAALIGGTARQVGAVLRHYGSNVAWWRVVNAAGQLPTHLHDQVRPHWAAEGIAWASSRRGCALAAHRVDEAAWAAAYAGATRDLPPCHRVPRTLAGR